MRLFGLNSEGRRVSRSLTVYETQGSPIWQRPAAVCSFVRYAHYAARDEDKIQGVRGGSDSLRDCA